MNKSNYPFNTKAADEDPMAQIMKELDEIKRYAAATYASVDKEIQEILGHLRELDKQIRDNDRQLDRIETYERKLNNMEAILKKLERKVK